MLGVNKDILKRNLFRKLKRRGRISTTTEETLRGPDRLFKTVAEECLWALNESGQALSVEELSKYLDFSQKSVRKSLNLVLQFPESTNFIVKKKEGKKFYYKAFFPKDTDIPTAFKILTHRT